MITTACTSCGARVIWTKTRNGKAMPVNAQPSERGNLALTEWDRPEVGDTVILAEHLNPRQADGMRAAGRFTYVSHFSDCPNASEHRKR